MDDGLDRLAAAFRTCEAQGWASVPAAVSADEVASLAAAVADVAVVPMDPVVGPVRQRGATGIAVVAGRPAVAAFADRLAAAADVARDGSVDGSVDGALDGGGAGDRWRPDELAITTYRPGDGISPHRDNAFFEGYVAVLTLSGEADLRAVADREGHEEVGRWSTGPGHLTLLRGPRPDGEARVLHEVGPAGPGGRRVLTLRRNARGAGAGWS